MDATAKTLQRHAAIREAQQATEALIKNYQWVLAELTRTQARLEDALAAGNYIDAARTCNTLIHHASVNVHPRLDMLANAQVALMLAAAE